MPSVPCSNPECSNTTKPGLRWCDECKKVRQAKDTKNARSEHHENYVFYNSKLWRSAQESHLKKEPYCRACKLENRLNFAQMVDHIVPISISWERRLDPTNLQSLCNRCHARKRAREGRMNVWGDDSHAEINVVCGPPGSGKTRYVNEQFVRGDLVIDLDRIFEAVSMLPMYDKPANLLPFVLEAKQCLINKVMLERDRGPRTWLITTGARSSERATYRNQLAAETIVIETPAHVCINRIRHDGRRPEQADAMTPIIMDWWDKYRPDELDVVVRNYE